MKIRRLTHPELRGGVLVLGRDDGRSFWRLLSVHLPNGQVEDPLVALSCRDLELNDHRAEEPVLLRKDD